MTNISAFVDMQKLDLVHRVMGFNFASVSPGHISPKGMDIVNEPPELTGFITSRKPATNKITELNTVSEPSFLIRLAISMQLLDGGGLLYDF